MALQSVEQMATDPCGFDIELGACQIDQTRSICSMVSVRTYRERQADPTCDKATIEVTMGDNYNISRSLTFLLPFPMIFTNLGTTKLTPPPTWMYQNAPLRQHSQRERSSLRQIRLRGNWEGKRSDS
jgi:hypothetical protein